MMLEGNLLENASNRDLTNSFFIGQYSKKESVAWGIKASFN